MALFPDYTTIPMQPTVTQRIRFKTLVSQFDEEGEENRKQKWLYPKRDLSVAYRNITKVNAETLWEFYLARKGQFEELNFFLPEPELTYPSYTGEYVGTGDGSTEVFNLPCKSSLGRIVYLDGVPQVEDTDYNYTALGGADGADKIDFSDSAMSAPSDGAVLTLDFTGVLKVHCVFAEDYFDFETFRDRIVSAGIELRGLLNT